MRNLKTIEGKVKAILEKDEEARNDDMLLYLKVCNTCLKDTGAMPFAQVMLQYTSELISHISRVLFFAVGAGQT